MHKILPLTSTPVCFKMNKFGIMRVCDIKAEHIRRILSTPMAQRRGRKFYISALYFDLDAPKNQEIIGNIKKKRTASDKRLDKVLENTWEFPTIFAREYVAGLIEGKLDETATKPICRALCTEIRTGPTGENPAWTKGFCLFLDTRRHDSEVSFVDKWDGFSESVKKLFLEYIIQLTMTALVYESSSTPARALLSDVLLSTETYTHKNEKNNRITNYINGFVLRPRITDEFTRVGDSLAQTILAECPQRNFISFDDDERYSEYADILPYIQIPLPVDRRRRAYDYRASHFASTRLASMWDTAILCDAALEILKLKVGDVGYFQGDMYTRRFLELPYLTRKITLGFAREQTTLLGKEFEDKRLMPEDIVEIFLRYCEKNNLEVPDFRLFNNTREMADFSERENIIFIDYSRMLSRSDGNVSIINPDGTYSEAKTQNALNSVLFDDGTPVLFDFYTRYKREHIAAQKFLTTQGVCPDAFSGFFTPPKNEQEAAETGPEVGLSQEQKPKKRKITSASKSIESTIRKCIRELDIKRVGFEKDNIPLGMAEFFETDLIDKYGEIVLHREFYRRKNKQKKKVSGSIILRSGQKHFDMPITIGSPSEKPFLGYDIFWAGDGDAKKSRTRVEYTLSFGNQFILAIDNNEFQPTMIVTDDLFPHGYRHMLDDDKKLQSVLNRSTKKETILKSFVQILSPDKQSQKADYSHSQTYGGILGIEDIKNGVQLKFMKTRSQPPKGHEPHIPRLETLKGYRVLGDNKLELLGREDIDVLLEMAYFYTSNMTFDVCISNETSKKTLLAKILSIGMYE